MSSQHSSDKISQIIQILNEDPQILEKIKSAELQDGHSKNGQNKNGQNKKGQSPKPKSNVSDYAKKFDTDYEGNFIDVIKNIEIGRKEEKKIEAFMRLSRDIKISRCMELPHIAIQSDIPKSLSRILFDSNIRDYAYAGYIIYSLADKCKKELQLTLEFNTEAEQNITLITSTGNHTLSSMKFELDGKLEEICTQIPENSSIRLKIKSIFCNFKLTNPVGINDLGIGNSNKFIDLSQHTQVPYDCIVHWTKNYQNLKNSVKNSCVFNANDTYYKDTLHKLNQVIVKCTQNKWIEYEKKFGSILQQIYDIPWTNLSENKEFVQKEVLYKYVFKFKQWLSQEDKFYEIVKNLEHTITNIMLNKQQLLKTYLNNAEIDRYYESMLFTKSREIIAELFQSMFLDTVYEEETLQGVYSPSLRFIHVIEGFAESIKNEINNNRYTIYNIWANSVQEKKSQRYFKILSFIYYSVVLSLFINKPASEFINNSTDVEAVSLNIRESREVIEYKNLVQFLLNSANKL